ncbi:MAG: hypothetical protein ACRC4W_08050 [Treponemataceae bacterium]
MGVRSSNKKTLLKKYIFGISVVLVIFLFSLLILPPLYNKVTQFLNNEKNALLSYLEDQFSISFSYESLSPSLLSGIRLRNFTITDTSSQTRVVHLNSFYVKYNLFQVLKNGMFQSIDAIILDGGVIRYDKNKNAVLANKISAFINENKQAKEILVLAQDTKALESDENFTQEAIEESTERKKNKPPTILLPPVVQLKNYVFQYVDNYFESNLELKSALLYSQGVDGGPQFFIEGQAGTTIKEGLINFLTEAHTGFFITGKFSPDLQTSSTQIRFESLRTETYSLNRLAFLLSHDRNIFKIRSIRNLQPYNLTANFDTFTSKGELHFDAHQLNPFSLFETTRSSALLEKIHGSLISGNYDIGFDFNKKAFSYKAKGDVFFPKHLLGEELSSFFAFNGNEKLITIKNFSITSELINASAQGSFDFITRQPQGYVAIESLKLENGNNAQAEFFIDKLPEGFMVFVPQIFFKDNALTALQATFLPAEESLDFSFEAYDFSHYEYDIPGKISLEGSFFINEEPYIQSSLSFENFFIDTIVQAIAFFSPANKQWALNQTANITSTYLLNTDTYLSTNFSDFSVNVATTLVTNTVRDREYAIFSLSGSSSSFNLSQLEMLIGGQLIFATGDVFIGENFSDVNFSTTLTANSVPYNIYATYVPDQTLSVYGDYGLTAFVDLTNNFSKIGSISMTNFPVPIQKAVFGISTQVGFSFGESSPLAVTIESFSTVEITETIDLKPRFGLSGHIINNELYFNTITYNDTISSLSGNSRASWNSIDEIFESFYFELIMTNEANNEKITASGLANNTKKLQPEKINFAKDVALFANISTSNFTLSRFFENQKVEDFLSATLTLSGTLEDPLVNIDIDKVLLSVNGQPLEASGSIDIEQEMIRVKGFNFALMQHQLQNIFVDFSLHDFNANLTTEYYGAFGSDFIRAPVQILVGTKPKQNKKIALRKNFFTQFDAFNIDVILSEINGSFFETMPTITFSARRSTGRFDISGGYNLSVLGYLLDTGELLLNLKDPLPVQLTAQGTIKDNHLDISINDLNADLSAFSKVLNYPYIAVNTALLKGNFHIGGLFSDPEFSGEVFGTQVNLGIPDYVGENLLTDTLYAQFIQNDLIVDNVLFKTQKGQVAVNMDMSFDRWKMDTINLSTRMIGKKSRVVAKYKIPMFEITADATANLDLKIQLGSISVTGDLFIENADAVVSSSKNETFIGDPNVAAEVDLQILLGKKVQAFFPSKTNPLIRGLIEPQTPLSVNYDSVSGDFEFKGDLNLRGGEVLYVKRNFYLKEGRVVLNATQDSFDPLITVRAEIKERDINNRSITIVLSSINQPLSEFSLGAGTQFSSIPAKNEHEIMKMLGQVFFADGEAENQWGDVLSSVADYGVQVALFRKVETQLRNWFNLDIFSLRLPFVQNTMAQILNQNQTTNQMTFGNFFNNSTVYVGKYFGDVIYVDASLELSFEEDNAGAAATNVQSISFQPSIGLELESPFGNIKWALSPEIDKKLKPIVQYNSISVSWKFVMN